MREQSSTRNPTANWRKYPKGPNFLGIVIGSSVVIILVFIAALIFLRHDAAKAIPHGPNPTPNSMTQPLFPTSAPQAA